MEPLYKWENKLEDYFVSINTYIENYDFSSLYPNVVRVYRPDSEPEEKTPTLNESRLKEIKP
jgi:hypothetical protein